MCIHVRSHEVITIATGQKLYSPAHYKQYGKLSTKFIREVFEAIPQTMGNIREINGDT